jgi:hypothetical protein
MRLYYLRHGFSHADAYLVSPLSKLGFMSLHSINNQQSEEELYYARSTLFLVLQGLRDQGRSYYITRTMFYIFKQQLRPEEKRYSYGSEDAETAADEKPGLIGKIQSAWTPRIVDVSDHQTAEELSKLANQFLGLNLREQSDDGTPSNAPMST